MLKELSSGHRMGQLPSQQTAARMVALRQIMSHLCHYALGEPPSGAFLVIDGDGEKTGGCTNPAMLAAALEDQQSRAEVRRGALLYHDLLIDH